MPARVEFVMLEGGGTDEKDCVVSVSALWMGFSAGTAASACVLVSVRAVSESVEVWIVAILLVGKTMPQE